MDPLQFLTESKGKEVTLLMVDNEKVSGVLISADDHGNVCLQHTYSDYTMLKENSGTTGMKRDRPTDQSFRLVRGASIKTVSAV